MNHIFVTLLMFSTLSFKICNFQGHMWRKYGLQEYSLHPGRLQPPRRVKSFLLDVLEIPVGNKFDSLEIWSTVLSWFMNFTLKTAKTVISHKIVLNFYDLEASLMGYNISVNIILCLFQNECTGTFSLSQSQRLRTVW